MESDRCLELMEKGRGARIHAEGYTYKGVLLSIMNFSKQVTGEMQYATYRCVSGEIVSEPFQGIMEEE